MHFRFSEFNIIENFLIVFPPFPKICIFSAQVQEQIILNVGVWFLAYHQLQLQSFDIQQEKHTVLPRHSQISLQGYIRPQNYGLPLCDKSNGSMQPPLGEKETLKVGRLRDAAI